MKILKFQNNDDWMAARRGKVTGSTLKAIASTGGVGKTQLQDALTAKGVEFKKADTIKALSENFSKEEMLQLEVDSMKGEKKIGYYQLLADRLADPHDTDEPAMERGNRLEAEAIDAFEKELGEEVELCRDKVLWVREDNDKISISPDSYILADTVTTAVEIKCLSSAKHIKARLEGQIPSEYMEQVKQYFVVNDDLQTLHFVFYDPRFLEDLQLHSVTFSRDQLENEILKYHAYQIDILAEIDDIVSRYTF